MIAILIAATIAFLIALVGTPVIIAFFRSRGFGQPIREEAPSSHQTKAGTPTMGGTAIVPSCHSILKFTFWDSCYVSWFYRK